MIFDNSLREPESDRFVGTPQTVAFHGTEPRAMAAIVREGFKVRRAVLAVARPLKPPFSQSQYNESSRYGIGTYTDKNGQIAMNHSKRDPVTGLYSVLVCRVLTGRQSPTAGSVRGPPYNCDSGADVSGEWINVTFQDFQARRLRVPRSVPLLTPWCRSTPSTT